MKTSRISRGFTLIELLVVITIISILTGILLVSLSGARGKARDTQRVSDLVQLQLALTMFIDRCGEYPTGATLTTSMTTTSCPSGVTLGTFISQVPRPPAGTGQTDYDYNWYRPTGGVKSYYILHATLEVPSAAIGKGIDYSTIPDPGGAAGTWRATIGSPQASALPPWSLCSTSGTSVHFCVVPN